jgi:hypothetical protein
VAVSRSSLIPYVGGFEVEPYRALFGEGDELFEVFWRCAKLMNFKGNV